MRPGLMLFAAGRPIALSALMKVFFFLPGSDISTASRGVKSPR